jgi:hypothetical protein
MALVAGVQAPLGRVMGHAGAFVGAGERSAKSKVKVLEDSGVTIVNHPSQFGEGMKRLLNNHVSTCAPSSRDRLLTQLLSRRAFDVAPKSAIYIHCKGLHY